MGPTYPTNQPDLELAQTDLLQRVDEDEAAVRAEPIRHVRKPGIICDTDTRGYATPNNQSLFEAVVGMGGFIPLWAPGTELRWRFQEQSLNMCRNPEAVKTVLK